MALAVPRAASPRYHLLPDHPLSQGHLSPPLPTGWPGLTLGAELGRGRVGRGLEAEPSCNPGPRGRRSTTGTACVPVTEQAAPDRASTRPCPRGGRQGWEPRTHVS